MQERKQQALQERLQAAADLERQATAVQQGSGQAGQKKKKKKKRGADGEDGEPPASDRRQLRPRRAARLAALLREEERGSSASEGSGSGGGGGNDGSKGTAAGMGAVLRPSAGSADYPPEAPARGNKSKRRSSGGGGGGTSAGPGAPQQPLGGLAAFQQTPQGQGSLPPPVQPGVLGTMASLPVMASGTGPMLPNMVPTPAAPPGLDLAAAAQQAQLVAAAIIRHARELGIGEHKIQSFLTLPPVEKIKIYRTLQQLVQQARARQQEQLQSAVLMQAAAPPPPQQVPMQEAPAALPGMPLPPLPLPPQEQMAQPAAASQFANLFSEMFD